jgi:hypothetical protein
VVAVAVVVKVVISYGGRVCYDYTQTNTNLPPILNQMRLLFAFDDYAMGNYPFSSTYIRYKKNDNASLTSSCMTFARTDCFY